MERRNTEILGPIEVAKEPVQAGGWRDQMRQAVRDPDALIDRLELPDELREGARQAAKLFPLVVPQAFLARMRRGDAADPLLRQVLPIGAEAGEAPPGFSVDPVGESGAVQAAGMLQKYHGRALLIVAGVCAVGCRYCFRRHFPYDESPSSLSQWQPAIDAIKESSDLEEIILSGGDPLMRSDEWLVALVTQLEKISHLRRLRIHTRLPIVIPDRVTDQLVALLASTRFAPTVVVHANHPAEIDAACSASLVRLVKAGVPVLNQAVLLKDVNDDALVLAELSRKLLDARVMPYYLNQLDPVAGADHFEVPVEHGLEIIAKLRTMLPGFGVPRYVREVCGASHKVEVQGLGE